MDGVSKQEKVQTNNLFCLYSPSESEPTWIDLVPNLNNNNNNNNNNNLDEKTDENFGTSKNGSKNNEAGRCDCLPSNRIVLNAVGVAANRMSADDNVDNDDNGDHVDDSESENDEENDQSDTSTDNLSFISDNENRGIVDDIILLPNNLLSDDELSNSDDCVYAYRGIDFDPVDARPEDENDFLEMDFEPDPPSEIEHENAATVESRGVEASTPSTSSDTTSDKTEGQMNEDRSIEDTAATNGECNSEVTNSDQPSSSASESNQPKKYTGTIPKTNRALLNGRTNRYKLASNSNKSLSSIEGEAATRKSHFAQQSSSGKSGNRTNKRWKITNEPIDDSILNPFYLRKTSDDQIDLDDDANSLSTHWKSANSTKRSLSFPFEQFRKSESNHEMQKPTTSKCIMQTSQSQNQLTNRPIPAFDGNEAAAHNRNDCAVIYSKDCTVKDIFNALEQINVQPDESKLSNILEKISNPPSQMNVAEYLVFISKRNSDFKAVINAIRDSCESVDLQIDFIPAANTELDLVHVSVLEILARLPTNGSLNNIRMIKNSQFHKFNVLGKVVNMIRKFAGMRHDMIQDNYIAIPQYYRSGFICVARK